MILQAVKRCCFALLWALAALAGVALYAAALSPRALEILATMLVVDGAPTTALRFSATVLLLLVLLILLAFVRRAPRAPDTLTFDTPDGHIDIASATLCRFIKTIIRNDARVKHAGVTTTLDERKVNVHARISVDEDQPITALATALQQTIRQRVYEAFGFDLLRDIRIEIGGIIPHEHHRPLLTWGRHDDDAQPQADAHSSASDATA